jgi:hypothetical protein
MNKLLALFVFTALICSVYSAFKTVTTDAQLKAAIASTTPSLFFYYSDKCPRSQYMKVFFFKVPFNFPLSRIDVKAVLIDVNFF